jgi:hypothetical protein
MKNLSGAFVGLIYAVPVAFLAWVILVALFSHYCRGAR